MSEQNIVVVGSGVSGLTTALLLSRDRRFNITVVAKHMPGDYDVEYASPWAGANFMPVSVPGSPAQKWETETWYVLQNLASNSPDAGIHFQDLVIHNRKKDVGSATATWFSELVSQNPWWKNLLPNYRTIPKSELDTEVDNGHFATSVCINTAIYLPWLVSQCLKNGVVFRRAVLEHIADAANIHHSGLKADLILNCTGLASRHLGGVQDQLVYPARGQIVVVRNELPNMFAASGTDDGPEDALYIMGRAAGDGTILGGCYQKNNWESQPDSTLSLKIMSRCVKACPELTNAKGIEHLDVIRHGVGLRPVRDGGARIEKDKINDTWVVHNYGHGGAGYQWSYGCGNEAVRLVDSICRSKAKL